MQKNGMRKLSDRVSNKNSRSNFGAMREYSDLYRSADTFFQAKKDARKAEKEELDKLCSKRTELYEQIGALKAKRRFEGLSREEQKRLNDLYSQVERINNDPLIKAKRKSNFQQKRGNAYNRAAAALRDELYELYLRDVKFLPKERDEFVGRHKDLIENMRFVYGGDIFEFVKDSETIQYRWVKH